MTADSNCIYLRISARSAGALFCVFAADTDVMEENTLAPRTL